MQHVFEFLVKEKENPVPVVHKFFVSQSSRMSKATKLFTHQLFKDEGVIMDDSKELYVRKIR